MQQLKKVIAPMLLLILLSVSPLWSGTTGKIAGVISDKDNGEPVIGATVIVMGTSLGAATDLDGHYTILYVPPGSYTLQISSVGYRKVTVKDVRVNIDQTARYDIPLEPQAIEVNALIIVGGKMNIKKDVATSVATVSDKEITNLPIANVPDILGMQAGVNITNNGKDIQIRGSSGDQSLFMVDGNTMRDPRNNQVIFKVPLNSIKEISVERGGFNAEYGQVQAGIINIVTSEGDKRVYSGGITVRVTPAAPKYYRGGGIPDIQDPNSYWLRPYMDNAVCWTGTNTPESQGGWDYYTRQKYLPFSGWNSISQQLCTDDNPNNDLTPIGAQRAFLYETRKHIPNNEPDYNIDAGFGGPVPLISEPLGNLRFFMSYRGEKDMLLFPSTRPDYNDHDWRVVLNSDINNSMRLHINGAAGNIATMAENWTYSNYPQTPSDLANGTGGSTLFNLFSDWTYSLTDISYKSASAKLTHTIGANTYYEVSLEHLERHYDTRPPAGRDTSQRFEIVPGFYESTNPFGYYPIASSGDGVIIWAGEQQSLARDNSTASVTTLKADFTSQVNFNNLVKCGVEFDYNDLNLDYGFIQMQTGGLNYANRIQAKDYPIRGALYVQDKLETEGFTLNAGLRLDYSNSEVTWPNISANPYDPNFIGSNYNNFLVFPTKSSEAQWQLSPRLGISHPITEDSKLFFNYGHFKEVPQYETLFRVQRTPDHSLTQLGDPNLTLAKTISYELGYDHLLFNSILLQVTAYYRDISNQQDTTRYTPTNGSFYYLSTSNLYSDIRGFEITIRKSTGRWFSGFINYTYQVVSSGNFNERQQFQDPVRQQLYNQTTVNLYQTRSTPTPYARANLSFYTPEDFGPILSNWRMDLLLNWSAGGWTTYNPQNVSGIVNNVQFVDYIDGTLRLSKTIVMKRFSLQFFADINNLFNGLRMSTAGIEGTSDQFYQASLHLPKSNAYNNIPGNDKFGEYRTPGTDWQPEVYQSEIQQKNGSFVAAPDDIHAFYYEGSTGKYWRVVKDPATGSRSWVQVDQATIDKVNKDKAYINMPGASTFWFLNPRAIAFGIRLSLDIE